MIKLRKETLTSSENDIKRLNQIAVLDYYQPLRYKQLAKLLPKTEPEDLPPFIERLNQAGIFEAKQDYSWFRHELIQKCLENSLSFEDKLLYYEKAAKFYLELFEKSKEDITLAIRNGCAYHFHKAGMYLREGREAIDWHQKSYLHNTFLAQYYSEVADLYYAERCYKRAICDSLRLKDLEKEIISIANLAFNVYFKGERYDEAYINFHEALRYCSIISDSWTVQNEGTSPWTVPSLPGKLLHNIAMIHHARAINTHYFTGEREKALEDYKKALKLYEESLSVKEKRAPRAIPGRARTLHNMAMIHQALGDHDKAIEEYNQSLSLWKQLENPSAIAAVLAKIDMINQEKPAGALTAYSIKTKYSGMLGEEVRNLNILREIGDVLASQDKNDYDRAIEVYHESLSIAKAVGDQTGIARALLSIGSSFIRKHDYKEALRYLHEAHKIFKALGDSQNTKIASDHLEYIRNAIEDSEYQKTINEIEKNPIRR